MNAPQAAGPGLVDCAPTAAEFREDVLAGLARPQKTIPCKYLYDARGSALFEEICAQPEYYLTRAELEILQRQARTLAELAGPACLLVELGSGSSRKTRLLLEHLPLLRAYVPVDISRSALREAAGEISRRHRQLEVLPVCADFTRDDWNLPPIDFAQHRQVFFFPGSTLGNFAPPAAVALLRNLRTRCRPGDALIVGVDLAKDARVLERAYNDAAGVTAAFNRNLLERANGELAADFPVARFAHRALFNHAASRVEMHLVSRGSPVVHLDGQTFAFAPGESIHTECSYKYPLDGFRTLARRAGFTPEHVWCDSENRFSVHWLAAR